MKLVVRSLGPPVAMLCAVAILCWNHLSPQTHLEPPVAKTPKLNPKRLTPTLPPRAERNLFARVEEAQTTPVVETPVETVSESESRELAGQRRLASDSAALVLRGAMLGRRPQAIINQQIVFVGDQLAVGRTSLVVQEIRSNAVLLSSEFGDVRLTYNRPADIHVNAPTPKHRPVSATGDASWQSHDSDDSDDSAPSSRPTSIFSSSARWLKQMRGVVFSGDQSPQTERNGQP